MKATLLLLAMVLGFNTAHAAADDFVTILDGFTVWKTEVFEYVDQKKKVCQVQTQAELIKLGKDCFEKLPSVVQAAFQRYDNSVMVVYQPSVKKAIYDDLVKKYGEPTGFNGEMRQWLLKRAQIIYDPEVDPKFGGFIVFYAPPKR